MKLVLVGAGDICQIFLNVFNSAKYEITAVCDNDELKWRGGKVEKYNIVPVTEIKNIKFDYICVTCNAYHSIRNQLLGMGIKNDIIIDFSFLSHYEAEIKSDIGRDILCTSYRFRDTREKSEIKKLERMQEIQMLLTAKSLAGNYKKKRIDYLSDVEFRVFSQNGEDGIIQWIVQNAEIENKVFVEFGVENYEESNTRYLLMNNNWSGLVMDGSDENVESIKNWSEYWRYDLTAKACFITKENINEKIREEGIEGNIGLLSVDIDGNDYWVLDEITCVDPVILICEYNSVWGKEKRVTIPYEASFQRTKKHYSNLYYGASLMAFVHWAKTRDYIFLGCNSAGNNAFFVKKQCFDESLLCKKPFFVVARARESRDEKGQLTYLPAEKRLGVIKEMDVYDLRTSEKKRIMDLYQL